jgi:hypothetical protein
MMSDWLSEHDARLLLVRKLQALGTREAIAREAQCSPSLISGAMAGTKPIGPKLCKVLGLIAVPETIYRYVKVEAVHE